MATLSVSDKLAHRIEMLAAQREQSVEDFLNEIVSESDDTPVIKTSRDALLAMATNAEAHGFASTRDDIAENSKSLLKNDYADDLELLP